MWQIQSPPLLTKPCIEWHWIVRRLCYWECQIMLLILLLQNSLKPSLQNEALWFWGTLTILWNSLIQISWDSILISYQDSLRTTASLGSSFIILVVSRDPLELYSNKCYFTQSNPSWTIPVKYCITAQYNYCSWLKT
jgi:hypothetical protein